MLFIFLNNKHNLFIYLLIFFLILIMNLNNTFVQWLVMEFSTIVSISLINIKSSNKIPSLIYYMISVISSMFLFLVIIIYLSPTYFLKHPMLNFLMQMMFFLKIGIFPFHYWLIYSYEMMKWNQIFLMSTLIKFMPIYMLYTLTYMNLWTMMYLLTSNLLISLFANKFYSLKKLLACSTIFNSLYFIMLLFLNKTLFFIFIIIYSINYYMLINYFYKFNINNLNFMFLNKYQSYMFLILIFNYSMFPILLTFIIKWMLIYLLISSKLYNWMLFIILISSMIMIWNYFILLKNLFMKMNFYKNNFMLNKNNMKLNLMLIIFLIFNMTFFLLMNFI
ncbi:NADH dehydrogenase subunit 2 (mitochondrion) [Apis florea]|uniref:NADH-ubiquinone oxidoreductase chain 2 n=1 Tax=Apis florea TaxID=7463 RepID=R4IQV1_APIFL|nr:NADH dehydrogenase subunit 2 [Apis florea]AFZ41098.1 NADH dehydrogenase subunit 2 [Apis florea]